jgi:hypothetical protein
VRPLRFAAKHEGLGQQLWERNITLGLLAWKDFYRQWRREDDWEWPVSEQFWLQHRRLTQAVRRHGLPPNPLANLPPCDLVRAALEEVATVGAASQNEIARVLPPTEELLP